MKLVVMTILWIAASQACISQTWFPNQEGNTWVYSLRAGTTVYGKLSGVVGNRTVRLVSPNLLEVHDSLYPVSGDTISGPFSVQSFSVGLLENECVLENPGDDSLIAFSGKYISGLLDWFRSSQVLFLCDVVATSSSFRGNN